MQRHPLATTIGRAQAALRAATDHALKPLGLTTSQYAACAELASEQRLSNAELARRCRVTPQTMLRVVEHLERAGLVEREPHRTHGRVIEVSLNVRGLRLVDRCHAAVSAIDRRMLRALARGEDATLDDLLTGCIHALERTESA